MSFEEYERLKHLANQTIKNLQCELLQKEKTIRRLAKNIGINNLGKEVYDKRMYEYVLKHMLKHHAKLTQDMEAEKK